MSTPSERKALMDAAAPERRGNKGAWIAAVIVLALLAGAIGYAIYASTKKSDETKQAASNVTAPPHGNDDKTGIIVNPGKAAKGAPVVALFQDYQCPICKVAEDKFGPTLEKLASDGKIQLEYHTMTFLDNNLKNDASTRSAQAAACADTVGAYAKYHDTIYKNQPAEEGAGYTDDQLRNTFPKDAGITGADLTKFQACVKNGDMKNWVIGTNDAAGKAGVTGTPTIQVNGKKFDLQQQFTSLQDFETKLLAAGK